MHPIRVASVVVTAFVAVSASAAETLRVVTWNISAYTGGKSQDIQNVVYGTFEGRSMRPDVILAQEIQSPAAASSFLSALNSSSGGPNDWAVSYRSLTGTNSTNDQVVFYRTSKVGLSSQPSLVLAAQGTSGSPRDVYRWDFNLATRTGVETLSMYNVHLKSGSSSTNDSRRLDATEAIRADANALPNGHHLIVAGDFNVQRATQNSYQELVRSQADNSGRFYDPIKSPGTWNNNANFRYLHTQDPTGSGGMDDRHDQLLVDESLIDGVGLDYVGNWNTAFSTSTWNDPNHSYRTWGNDGSTYGVNMAITGNSMVGSLIAQSLANLAGTNGGHLPVFLDLRYEAVPEPATMVALSLGAFAALRRRRKA